MKVDAQEQEAGPVCEVCGSPVPAGQAVCPECVESNDEKMGLVARKFYEWLNSQIPDAIGWAAATRYKCQGKSDREMAEMAIRQASAWSGRVGFVAGLGDFAGPLGFGAQTS